MHWSEYGKESLSFKVDEYKRDFSITVILPVIPRIGESIEFELADHNGYPKGTVYQIDHEVIGKKQCITIFTHPYENAYYNWQRLKQEYEIHQKWRRNNVNV